MVVARLEFIIVSVWYNTLCVNCMGCEEEKYNYTSVVIPVFNLYRM